MRGLRRSAVFVTVACVFALVLTQAAFAVPSKVGSWTGLSSPTKLDVAPNGYVYVPTSNAILYYDHLGAYKGQWSIPYICWGLGVGPDGTVYAADYTNGKVHRYTATGTQLTEWGTFSSARSIDVAQNGDVYVADQGANQVTWWSADGTTLKGQAAVTDAMGIAVGTDGTVYVAQNWQRKVSFYTPSLELTGSWATTGACADVEVLADGSVIVLQDALSGIVTKYTASGQFVEEFSAGTFVYGLTATALGTTYYLSEYSNGAVSYWGAVPQAPAAAPVVTGFSPASAQVGDTVTITGTDFTGATAVSFNGTAATSFTVVSATEITAVVPEDATSGTLSVTGPGGTASSAESFTLDESQPATVSTPSSALWSLVLLSVLGVAFVVRRARG